MPFVVDPSVAACWWCFPDEDSAAADTAMDRLLHDEAIAPGLWILEITNILIVSERHGRVSHEETDAFLGDLAQLPIRIRHDADERELLPLARKQQLTTYDASYVELAARTGAAVATLDRWLAGAARAEDLEIVGG